MLKHVALQFILLSVFALFSGCLEKQQVEIVAHRGASYDAPENTIAAFDLAWHQGADYIEGDFYLTKDNRIVCIHDSDTKRIAGVELVVAETSLEQLRQLDVGSWKGGQWTGEKIPTIREVFDTVPDDGKILIEIKCGPEIVPFLKTAVAKSGLRAEQMVVISFKESVVAAVKQQVPELRAYWLTGFRQNDATGAWHPDIMEVLATLQRIKADGLDSNAHQSIDAEFVAALRDAGMAFHVWTVDDPEIAKRFIGLGTESITTNRPAWLRQQLGL